ncbi:tyrosine-type recombinase/integrase [Bacillus vallismortis]|nr:tyrosine-type recombinase/integrase [Bacillus vallismortis]
MHENELTQSASKKISPRHKSFKPFLHHISKNKLIDKNILKIKAPKRQIRTLSQDQVQAIYDNCTNIRDELLIRILYEGGLRKGEAIAFEIDLFNITKNSIRVKNSKTAAGENRIVFVSPETMNLFQEYLIDFHAFEVDSNYVFVKLKGVHKEEPLNRNTIESIVRRLRNKTGIDFTPHMLRHTYATELHNKGVEIIVIQKLLGHAQVQTTINTYVHINDKKHMESYKQAIREQKKEV